MAKSDLNTRVTWEPWNLVVVGKGRRKWLAFQRVGRYLGRSAEVTVDATLAMLGSLAAPDQFDGLRAFLEAESKPTAEELVDG